MRIGQAHRKVRCLGKLWVLTKTQDRWYEAGRKCLEVYVERGVQNTAGSRAGTEERERIPPMSLFSTDMHSGGVIRFLYIMRLLINCAYAA